MYSSISYVVNQREWPDGSTVQRGEERSTENENWGNLPELHPGVIFSCSSKNRKGGSNKKRMRSKSKSRKVYTCSLRRGPDIYLKCVYRHVGYNHVGRFDRKQ